MRASPDRDASTSATRSFGAKVASDSAVAHPAGPAPAIRTSKFAMTWLGLTPVPAFSARPGRIESTHHAGRVHGVGLAARMPNGSYYRTDNGRDLINAVRPVGHQISFVI